MLLLGSYLFILRIELNGILFKHFLRKSFSIRDCRCEIHMSCPIIADGRNTLYSWLRFTEGSIEVDVSVDSDFLDCDITS